MSTIFFISFLSSLWKITISSILFMNSGFNSFFNSFITDFFISIYCNSSSLFENPNFLFSTISLAPMFDVIMIIEFLKLTFLPWLSVKIPSSKIWSNKFKTSGCAFSISSKSITEYGFNLTFSVNSFESS